MRIAFLILFAPLLIADGPGVMLSQHAPAESALTADPDSPFWKGVPGVVAEKSASGDPTPGHRTEFRSRWSEKNLYLLFICPYEALHLRPRPSQSSETNKLWEWDVAEAFIGTDLQNIRKYKEFQVSPQSEWVDLDIDRDHPNPDGGWLWNSGFEVKGRIDAGKKVWYGEMRIPLRSIDAPPKAGLEVRINLYRIQGPGPERKFIAWQPTGQRSHHVPESFGRLRLVK